MITQLNTAKIFHNFSLDLSHNTELLNQHKIVSQKITVVNVKKCKLLQHFLLDGVHSIRFMTILFSFKKKPVGLSLKKKSPCLQNLFWIMHPTTQLGALSKRDTFFRHRILVHSRAIFQRRFQGGRQGCRRCVALVYV